MGLSRDEYLSRAREFSAKGKALPQSKLDAAKVVWIRANREGLTAKAQAERLGVHYRTIEKVRHYETWAHVRESA